MIDSHCHLEFGDFDRDREDVIEKSRQKIDAVVDSSARIETSKDVINLHEKHSDFIFPTLGLHPKEAAKTSEHEISEYRKFIEEKIDKIVGIGEVGLDYHHVKGEGNRKRCKRIFEDFIEISNFLNLPLIVHSRKSMKDTMKILKEAKNEVIIHCFSGNIENLEESLDRGYYLSFGGIIFRSADRYRKILEKVPLQNLLLETDSPFLAKKKNDRTNPWFIREVAEKIAEIKDMKFSEIWKNAGDNAKKVYDLPIN